MGSPGRKPGAQRGPGAAGPEQPAEPLPRRGGRVLPVPGRPDPEAPQTHPPVGGAPQEAPLARPSS